MNSKTNLNTDSNNESFICLDRAKKELYLKAIVEAYELTQESMQKNNITTFALNNESIKIIFKEYEKLCQTLKSIKLDIKTKIDSHNIVALFSMLLIKHKVVHINKFKELDKINNKKIGIYLKVPEIVFSYIFAHVIMEKMYNMNTSQKISFPIMASFINDFVKIFEYNKINLENVRNTNYPINYVKISLFLSALFYFIEKCIIKELEENKKREDGNKTK